MLRVWKFFTGDSWSRLDVAMYAAFVFLSLKVHGMKALVMLWVVYLLVVMVMGGVTRTVDLYLEGKEARTAKRAAVRARR